MNTYILLTVLILSILSCKAQTNTKSQPIKTFARETFNKNTTGAEFMFITDDNTQIMQKEICIEYEEPIKPKDSYINMCDINYKEGKLKLTGGFLSKYLEIGIWKEFNAKGHLVKETNFDVSFKFTWEDILKFIKDRKIDMGGHYIDIGRNIVGVQPVWGITHEKQNKNGLHLIGIDGVTGEVFGECDRDYPEE